MFKNITLSKISLFLSITLSIIATYISYTTNNILAYNDATAHLNTARRMIDNLTPGLAQIGSVWLPLLHVFELPFVASNFLWQTGLAGAIVSGASFVVTSFFLYRLLFYMTKSAFAAFLGVLILITNINLLYLQTTAMFEPLLMATELGAVYFFTKWANEFLLRDLVLAALFTMLATLTRYDGWALFIAGSVFVLIVSLFSQNKNKEGKLFIFIALAGFGIAMWLLYNQIIFGDALFFARSEFSAAAQQEILYKRGALLTKHNLQLSFITYTLSTIFNVGVVIVGLGILGLLFYLIHACVTYNRNFLGPLLLTVPYFFNIVSLYLGQSVIWMPMLPPHFATYFNIRYGLLMLPAFAFFGAYPASKFFIGKLLVIAVIIGQIILFASPHLLPIMGRDTGIVTLADTVSSVNTQTKAASSFLHDNYTGGLILVSSASSDAFIFRCNIELKNFITEGTGKYWKLSLGDPIQYATWLVFFQDRSDRVGKVMPPKKILEQNFTLVYEDQTYEIWKKK